MNLKEWKTEDDCHLALRRAMRQLDLLKNKQSGMVDAAYEAAKDAISALKLQRVASPPAARRRTKKSLTAIAPLSDWQLAKITPSYTSDICEQRIEVLGDKILKISDLQRVSHRVTNLWVPLLGDLIEGELIFPGQAHLIDSSLYQQVMVDGPRILGNFLRRMLGSFHSVEVDGIIGNHGSLGGRSRRDMHPETNGDAMMYEITRQVLEAAGETRLHWSDNRARLERNWYKVKEINGRGWLIFHGDQCKGGGGIAGLPYPNMASRVLKWASGGIPEAFEFALMGHYHTPTRLTIGNKLLWMSGSTESDNTYASERLGAMGHPSQWLIFVGDDGLPSAEYQIRLTA